MSGHSPGAADDYSKETLPETAPHLALGAFGSVLAALGLAGAVLAVVATFSTVIRIRVLTVTTAHYTGMDRNGVAYLILGGFALLMLAGAARGARPAMLALGLIGLAGLLIAVLHDLPHLNDTGVWPLHDQYEDAQASAGSGYYLETAAGILMMVSGVGLLLLTPGGGPAPRRRRGSRRGPVERAERTRHSEATPLASDPAPAPGAITGPPDAPPVAPSHSERTVDDWFTPPSARPAPVPPPPPARRRSRGLVARLRGRR